MKLTSSSKRGTCLVLVESVGPFVLGLLLLMSLMLSGSCCLFRAAPKAPPPVVRTVTVTADRPIACLSEPPPQKRSAPKDSVLVGGEADCPERFANCLTPRGSLAVETNLKRSANYNRDAWILCKKAPHHVVDEGTNEGDTP